AARAAAAARSESAARGIRGSQQSASFPKMCTNEAPTARSRSLHSSTSRWNALIRGSAALRCSLSVCCLYCVLSISSRPLPSSAADCRASCARISPSRYACSDSQSKLRHVSSTVSSR
ncbi:hypothetical protein PFISCL1PPCAC_8381, partial [Pristionchus fissidentatus]